MKNGKKFYHVTDILSVINPAEYTVSEEELNQYAARGTLIHQEASLLLGHAIDLREKRACEEILEKGSLGMKPINPKIIENFISQFRHFGWGHCDCEVELWSENLALCGTADLVIQNKDHLMIADWKTSKSYDQAKKDHYFKQIAAYIIMWEEKTGGRIEEMAIFPLNPKNKKGFGAPITTKDIDKYKNLFMEDYKKFILLTK